eukprot:scaffold5231_cov83-Cylindrotheca_fusiformis.AAC.2
MEFSLSTLGCPTFSLGMSSKRRTLVALHTNAKPQSPNSETMNKNNNNSSSLFSHHKDSFWVYLEQAYRSSIGQASLPEQQDKLLLQGSNNNDDDTVTTISSSSSSSDGLDDDDDGKMVTFCDPLVTAVYTRPLTSKQDKYYLHYNEHDYIDFKLEYMTGRARNRKVSFAREHQVHPIDDDIAMDPSQKKLLYYTESELQK